MKDEKEAEKEETKEKEGDQPKAPGTEPDGKQPEAPKKDPKDQKKKLAIGIGVLGVLCVICGIAVLVGGGKTPVTADPTPPIPVSESTPVSEPVSTATSDVDSEPYVSPIDFATLQAENPDIYAWLRIPNTEFDFPILQREGDDEFYLTHDSDGNESSTGAIFTEGSYNGKDFEDALTVAYGHQMHSGTMFGKLQATYPDPESLNTCGEIDIYLPDKEYHYQVFATVPYDNRHILYNYDDTDPRRVMAFLNSVYSVREIGANFSDSVTASGNDKILVLSTCLEGNSQKRYLVLAKRQDEIN